MTNAYILFLHLYHILKKSQTENYFICLKFYGEHFRKSDKNMNVWKYDISLLYIRNTKTLENFQFYFQHNTYILLDR